MWGETFKTPAQGNLWSTGMNNADTPPRPLVPSTRGLWLNLCLCIGLIVGFLLSLLSLTGAALVFIGPMTRMEVGYHLFAAGKSPAMDAPVDEWIANAHRAYGGLNAVEFVSGPGYGFGGGTTLMARTAEGKHSVVSIDPDNGVPLANFIWDDTYSTSILKFHARLASLLSGATRTLAAPIMFGAIVLTAIGLCLWWPRQGSWRTAFMPLSGARGLRRWLDLSQPRRCLSCNSAVRSRLHRRLPRQSPLDRSGGCAGVSRAHA